MTNQSAPKKLSNDDSAWNYFKTLEYWKPSEFLWILNGYYPRGLEEFVTFPQPQKRKLAETYDAINRSLKTLHSKDEFSDLFAWLSPFNLLEWAKSFGFKIPSPLTYNYKHEGNNKVFFWVDDRAGKGNQQRTRLINNNDEVENIIKNITIRYENDSQITIQQKGKQKISIPLDQLRFKGAGIVWKNFLKVLQTPPAYHWLCPENKDLKQIETVSQRLMEWLKKNLEVSFPKGYKLHERVRGKENGTYRFKFNVEYCDTIDEDESSKTPFRKKFFDKLNYFSQNRNNMFLSEEIKELAKEGLIKNYLVKDELMQELASTRKDDLWGKMSAENYNTIKSTSDE